MSAKDNDFISFNNNQLKHVFILKYGFDFLKLNKLILVSHVNSDEKKWLELLLATNLVVREVMINKTEEDTYNLLRFVSVNHRFPILELSIEVPRNYKRQLYSTSPLVKNIELELIINSKIKDDFEYVIYYEITPGIYEKIDK